jgi:hypothetical protein
MDVFTKNFTAGQVVAAADITGAALQTWIRRGVIVGHRGKGVEMPGKPGRPRAFSFYNVMEIATAAALIKVGVDVAPAFRAAQHFSHSGAGGRLPGLPFNTPVETFLVCAGERTVVVPWRPGTDFISEVRSHLGFPVDMTVVDALSVFDRAAAAIGEHPEDLLEAAYAGLPDEDPEFE